MSKELPTIEELRASQKAGSEGKGTAPQTYNEMQGDFNMGTGVDVSDTKYSPESGDSLGWM